MQPYSNLARALMALRSMPHGGAHSYKRGYSFRPQSEESKQFHLGRALDKRKRKSAINHQRVLRGEMDYAPAHIERERIVVLGKSEVYYGDTLLGTAKRTVIKPAESGSLEGMTVSELIAYGKSRGAHVTTKMTKAKLIEAINAAQ